MRLRKSDAKTVKQLWLILGISLAMGTPVYATNFYTIIGPDGHPMVVQKIAEKPKKTETKNTAAKKIDVNINKNDQIETDIINKNQSVQQKMNIESSRNTITKQNQEESKTVSIELSQPKNVQNTTIIQQEVKAKNNTDTLQQPQIKEPISPQLSKIEINQLPKKILIKDQKQAINLKPNTESTVEQIPILSPAKDDVQPSNVDNKNFTTIDGEKYVSNEYLEDQEFNLEGKKRFYMTPEIGAVHGRYETIERQKGVSASLLDRIRGNSKIEEKKAIVLASSYYRLPKEDVTESLEQGCFSGKKILKAKNLSIKNQEVGLWPVAPIKENFAYEVIKLDQQVQNILLTSYASSSKVPTYYWPLVVFLDQKGCVLEGVGGFKNEEIQDNNMQFSAMEGILRKPEKAVYMFLTPLSSAVDVENKQLTNHGQIKLSVIQ